MSLGKNPRKECNFFTVAMKEPLKPGRKYEIRVENRGCSTDQNIFRFHSNVFYASALFYISFQKTMKPQHMHKFQPSVQLKSAFGFPRMSTDRHAGGCYGLCEDSAVTSRVHFIWDLTILKHLTQESYVNLKKKKVTFTNCLMYLNVNNFLFSNKNCQDLFILLQTSQQ